MYMVFGKEVLKCIVLDVYRGQGACSLEKCFFIVNGVWVDSLSGTFLFSDWSLVGE